MQTSSKIRLLAEQEMMNDLVKLLKEREENGTVKIRVALNDLNKQGLLTKENWELTFKYGSFISISRQLENNCFRTYIYDDAPPDGNGIFYWFYPNSVNDPCERIRIFPVKDENEMDPSHVIGEVWVCGQKGTYEKGFVGENQMSFRWP